MKTFKQYTKATIKKLLPKPLSSAIINTYLRIKLFVFGPTAFVPHDVQNHKTNLITEWQQHHQYSTLIETGTYMGDMVQAQKNNFKQVISVELAPHLAKAAKKRFLNDDNVTIIEGDSGQVLHKVIQTLSSPAIFWLDGHYSAGLTAKGETECPIFGELDAILSNTGLPHIILIDDASDFNGQGDYPTIDTLTTYIQNANPNYNITIKDNIICYYQ